MTHIPRIPQKPNPNFRRDFLPGKPSNPEQMIMEVRGALESQMINISRQIRTLFIIKGIPAEEFLDVFEDEEKQDIYMKQIIKAHEERKAKKEEEAKKVAEATKGASLENINTLETTTPSSLETTTPPSPETQA